MTQDDSRSCQWLLLDTGQEGGAGQWDEIPLQPGLQGSLRPAPRGTAPRLSEHPDISPARRATLP